jgi:hypothetical protein
MFFFSSILSMEKKKNLTKGLNIGPLGWGARGEYYNHYIIFFLEIYIVKKKN